jgi:hypothetical protein
MSDVLPIRAVTAPSLLPGSFASTHSPESQRGDYALASVCVFVIVLSLMVSNKAVIHWMLFPLIACGILSGVDVVRWLRGRMDLFDPKTVIGVLSFYGFFVAPMLHVVWNRYGAGYDLNLSGDWRPWLGAMACLDAAGLLAYRLAHNFAFNRTANSSTVWELDPKRFYPVFGIAWLFSAGGVAYFMWQFNGLYGVVEAFETDKLAFTGKGWLLVFGWPLAILSFIIFVFVLMNLRGAPRHFTIGLVVLAIAGLFHFVLMGWYGSRSATVWALFWMAGIIHYHFRKWSSGWVLAGLVFLIAFMYFYGFYKESGRAGFEVLRSPAMWLDPQGYERDLKGMLLGDLARADVDAYILYSITTDPKGYDYRWGLTYAGAFAILIPKSFWPDRPEYKVDAGTEAIWGKSSQWRSSRLYGVNGEALLNFGPWGVVPAFAIYGAVLGWYRRKHARLDRLDARIFLAPFVAILFVTALVADSDNIVFTIVSEGSLIFTCLLAASKPRREKSMPAIDQVSA